MSFKTNALTQKNSLKGFYKILFTIAVPIILQNLLQTFINMMDTVMVGRLGSVEIAAVGLGNQIFFYPDHGHFWNFFRGFDFYIPVLGAAGF